MSSIKLSNPCLVVRVRGLTGLMLNSIFFIGISLVTSFIMLSHIFFFTGHLPNSWGKTFVTLIPKKNNPSCVTDFRPISLCNVSYKVISKILANRLKPIIPNLIGPEQNGFSQGVALLTTSSQPRR